MADCQIDCHGDGCTCEAKEGRKDVAKRDCKRNKGKKDKIPKELESTQNEGTAKTQKEAANLQDTIGGIGRIISPVGWEGACSTLKGALRRRLRLTFSSSLQFGVGRTDPPAVAFGAPVTARSFQISAGRHAWAQLARQLRFHRGQLFATSDFGGQEVLINNIMSWRRE